MSRAIYRAKDQWVLAVCSECGRENYVEPHGTTARCSTEGRATEHRPIPQSRRDPSGTLLRP
jgi:hypothetical protein